MKKYRSFNLFLFLGISSLIFYAHSLAEEAKISVTVATQGKAEAVQAAPESPKESPVQILSNADNVTLDFKEADIQNVLKIISYKAGVNIVTTPEVMGNVTIRMVDVPWETALDVILKTYGFSYQKQGNIILVTKMENMAKLQAEEPLQTEIFTLKFLDAQDAQKIIIPLLSNRGKVSVLYTRGQKGWQFGTFKIGKDFVQSSALVKEKSETKSETISIENTASGEPVSRKAEFEPSVKSKVLIITDTPASLDRIRSVIIPTIDKKPKQVLIETRIMEVKKDRLKDIGVDWGTGTDGVTATTPTDVRLGGGSGTLAGRNLGGGGTFTPNAFNPLEGTTNFPGTYPYKAGAEFIFKKIAGVKLEVILHALEEDANTNTLSAPRILTLDNQEASILVGYHTPILTSTVTAGTASGEGATVTQTLDYYQEIGIRLNVVPQVSEEGYINMIIHPSVTSSTSNVTATSTASGETTSTSYPIIDVREAQTQVMLKNNETIVIGGLLKDVKTKERIGVPFLMDIPWLGKFFTRETTSVAKVDLLIFITARIIEDNELSKEELERLEKGVDYMPISKDKKVKKRGWDSLLAP